MSIHAADTEVESSTMAALINKAQAKAHLRVDGDEHDVDIVLKMNQANAAILDRCNSTAWWRVVSATWTDATVPLSVQAAMLVLLTHLYEHRGDDLADDGAVWATVDKLISLHKDPVIA